MRLLGLVVMMSTTGCTRAQSVVAPAPERDPPAAAWHMPAMPSEASPLAAPSTPTPPMPAEVAPPALAEAAPETDRVPRVAPLRPRPRYPRCVLDSPDPDGLAARAAVRRVAKRFRRCYANSLKSNPDAYGKVELHVSLHPDGRVKAVGANTDNPALESMLPCLKAVVRGERFPPGGDCGDELLLPIVFAPGR